MTTIIVAVVAVVATLLIAVPITSKVSVDNKVKKDAETIGSAEEKARGIIDEALKAAETKRSFIGSKGRISPYKERTGEGNQGT